MEFLFCYYLIHVYFKQYSNVTLLKLIYHDCTNRSNLEMEPKYLTKSDVQLKPNISRTKNDNRVL